MSYFRGTCTILLEKTVVMDLWPYVVEVSTIAEPSYKRLVMAVCVFEVFRTRDSESQSPWGCQPVPLRPVPAHQPLPVRPWPSN